MNGYRNNEKWKDLILGIDEINMVTANLDNLFAIWKDNYVNLFIIRMFKIYAFTR